MERSEAKRWFVYYLRRVDETSDWQTFEELFDHDEVVDPSEELDRLGELLWGCHDVIRVRRSALEAIGLEPGATYHEAVLWLQVTWLSEHGDDTEVVRNLYEVFVKDQRGRHGGEARVDRDTYYAWLSEWFVGEADDLIRLWDQQRVK